MREITRFREKKHVNNNRDMFVCDSCKKAFRNRQALVRHAVVHQKVGERKLYLCFYDSCPKFYHHQRNLNDHIHRCHDTRHYMECTFPNCNRKLSTQSMLEYHMACHKIMGPLPRPDFIQPSDAKKGKEFICSICTKIFKEKKKLRRHVQTHIPVSERQRLSCPYASCNKTFTNKDSVNAHVKSKHYKYNKVSRQKERDIYKKLPTNFKKYSQRSSILRIKHQKELRRKRRENNFTDCVLVRHAVPHKDLSERTLIQEKECNEDPEHMQMVKPQNQYNENMQNLNPETEYNEDPEYGSKIQILNLEKEHNIGPEHDKETQVLIPEKERTSIEDSEHLNEMQVIIPEKECTSNEDGNEMQVLIPEKECTGNEDSEHGNEMEILSAEKSCNEILECSNKIRTCVKNTGCDELKMFACDTCKKVFKKKYTLVRHTVVHQKIGERKLFHCFYDTCPKFYHHQRNLNDHIRRCHDVRHYKECTFPKCKRKLSTQSMLEYHMASHKVMGPLPRPDFIQPSDIDKGKEFICSICTKTFKQKKKLRRHVQTHIPVCERPRLPCPNASCDKTFTDKDSVAAHVRKKHQVKVKVIRNIAGSRKQDRRCANTVAKYENFFLKIEPEVAESIRQSNKVKVEVAEDIREWNMVKVEELVVKEEIGDMPDLDI